MLSLIQVLLNVTMVLWLQTYNYFISQWELLALHNKAEKSLQKSVIFYEVVRTERQKKENKFTSRNAILNCLE